MLQDPKGDLMSRTEEFLDQLKLTDEEKALTTAMAEDIKNTWKAAILEAFGTWFYRTNVREMCKRCSRRCLEYHQRGD